MGCILALFIGTSTLLTVSDVNAFSEKDYATRRQFRMTGHVVSKSNKSNIFFRDASGRIIIKNVGSNAVSIGDIVDIGLVAQNNKLGEHELYSTGLKVVGFSAPEQPAKSTVAQALTGECDYRNVIVEGIVTDAFTDEIDPECRFMLLSEKGYTITVQTGYANSGTTNDIALVGARVRVTGAVSPMLRSWRKFMERSLCAIGEGLGVAVVEPAPSDVFEVPRLKIGATADPRELQGLGLRRVTGRVIAVWGGSKFLVDSGAPPHPMLISCANGVPPPQYGDMVTAVGFPATDLFGVILRRAHWRRESVGDIKRDKDAPLRISARDLLCHPDGRPQYHAPHYGHLLTMSGIVRSISADTLSESKLHLDCDGFSISVDASGRRDALEGISIGCAVDVTGVCLMVIDPWSPGLTFPHITDVVLVIRTPEDIVVTSRPSWWTPSRLAGLVVALLVALVGFTIWNRLLNRLVARRSRQLLHEQVARASADLRVGERTRLAVELHDSLSQSLAGVACQITATKRAMALHPEQALPSLEKAEQMLLSSRTDLKRCIMGLRSDALEAADIQTAVRKTLNPVIENAELDLDIAIPRNRLTDSTAHAILCILRELASNSVRHGHARTIRVTGGMDGPSLLLSVVDDGCGFDAENPPGPETGHFGITGIRERTEHLGGHVDIKSSPGEGTRASIYIPLTLHDLTE